MRFFVVLVGFLAFEEFTVRNVVIIGNKHLTDKEIRAILSIKEGNSIIYPSSKTLYERLKKNAMDKRCNYKKRFKRNNDNLYKGIHSGCYCYV